MDGRRKFKRYNFIIQILSLIFRLTPKFFRVFLWDTTSKYSQIIFIGFRYIILKSLIKECGNNVRIGTNVTIIGWNNLIIMNNVSIHSNCYIDATGIISIGNDVSIAHNSSIISANHTWSQVNVPIKYNKIVLKNVKIENNVWIGCGCRILAGVKIESRSIIAAGAVVNEDVKSNTIVGGIPAKKIKEI